MQQESDLLDRFLLCLTARAFHPFGEVWGASHANTIDQDGFTGHIRDTDTGLTHMQARYYDPVIGRFLSPAPVKFTDGGVDHFNTDWYGNGNPVNNIDPDGRDVEEFDDSGEAIQRATEIVSEI